MQESEKYRKVVKVLTEAEGTTPEGNVLKTLNLMVEQGLANDAVEALNFLKLTCLDKPEDLQKTLDERVASHWADAGPDGQALRAEFRSMDIFQCYVRGIISGQVNPTLPGNGVRTVRKGDHR